MEPDELLEVAQSLARVNQAGRLLCDLNPAEFILLMKTMAAAREAKADQMLQRSNDPHDIASAEIFKEIAKYMGKAADATQKYLDLKIPPTQTPEEILKELMVKLMQQQPGTNPNIH